MSKKSFSPFFILVFLGFTARADFQINLQCVKGAKAELASQKFGQNKWDDGAFNTLCTANDNASVAYTCVETVVKSFPNMTPWGLAAVCSGGVSGEFAMACLNEAQNVVMGGWVSKVDSCTGIMHKYTACTLQSEKEFKCSNDKSLDTSAAAHREH